jgi:hypothetical protein
VAALLDDRIDETTGYRLEPLLTQLAEAVEPSGGHGGAVANIYRSPAALEVLALLAEIDRVTTHGLRASGHRERIPVERSDRLWLWSIRAHTWRSTSPRYLAKATRAAVSWRDRATAIITPDQQIVETRAQPCPSCGKRTAFVWSPELAERVQRPSLYLDKDAMTVYCRCCSAQWGQDLWGLLRRVLELSS